MSSHIKKSVRQMQKQVKKNIPAPLRRQVWETYIGYKYKVFCLVCNHAEITPFAFECGHVQSDLEGGSITVDNLRPICSSCNKSMGTLNLYDFKYKYYPISSKFNFNKILTILLVLGLFSLTLISYYSYVIL